MSYAGAPDRPIALFTGALGGIGRACCERLATDYRLALLDLGGERLYDQAIRRDGTRGRRNELHA